jgi:hypothetical protein
MPLYALLNNADDSLIRIENQPPGWLPENAVNFGPEHETRWVQVQYDTEPAYDAATHYLRRKDPVLEGGKWVYKWEAVEKPVPTEVFTWQLREACELSTLRSPTLKDAIDAAIALLPAQQRIRARNRWVSKPTIRRTDPLTLQLIAGLNLTEAEADALFKQAAQIQ